MIISVKVPVNAFRHAVNTLKTNEYYVLHVARVEIEEIRDIQRSGMEARFPYSIIRVMNEEDESEWFLSQCESVQLNEMIFSWDILLTGIVEVTNQATLDLLNVTPHRQDNAWWNIVEETVREEFRARERDAVCNPFEVGTSFEKFYMQRPFYRRLSLDTQQWTPYGKLEWTIDHPDLATEIATYLSGIAQADHSDSEPNLDKNKDVKENDAPAKLQMSINELLFGGD